MLASACHCTGCQRMSGSAFSLTLTVPAQAFEVTKGEAVLGGAKGPIAHHHHCPECLSWVYTTAEGMEDQFVNVRATMLDDARGFEPYLEVWTSEKLPWVTTPAEVSFEREPDFSQYGRFLADYAAWRAARAGG
ncbi:MAG: GFA family protein [Deltaproteobacteria bacterium]|nr:GFA family protein [Deltaproteobacteria bacterium]